MYKSLLFSYIFVLALIAQQCWSFGVLKIYGGDEYKKTKHLSVGASETLDKTKMVEALVETPAGSGNYCGGTIVGDRFIVFAAQCIFPEALCGETDIAKIKAGMFQPNQLQVYIEGICYSTAESDAKNNCAVEDRGRLVSVKSLHVLETYWTSSCRTGNLAILELSEIIGDHGASLSNNRTLPVFGDFIVSGFGVDPNVTIYRPKNSHMLKTVTLTAKICETNSSDFFCTHEVNKDACEGDAGAGLLDKNNVIYGVYFGGTSCAVLYSSVMNHESEGLPLKEFPGGASTSVSLHLGFLCEIVGSSVNGCAGSTEKEKYLTLP